MIVTKYMIDKESVHNKDLWGTPWPIFNKIQADLKITFTLDPCASEETAKCKMYFDERINGLLYKWRDHTIFCNPPYSRYNIDKWVAKCDELKDLNRIVMLLPVSTSADWYQNHICGKQEIWFVNKRIRFIGAPWTAPFSSMIVIFNGKNIHRSWDQP